MRCRSTRPVPPWCARDPSRSRFALACGRRASSEALTCSGSRAGAATKCFCDPLPEHVFAWGEPTASTVGALATARRPTITIHTRPRPPDQLRSAHVLWLARRGCHKMLRDPDLLACLRLGRALGSTVGALATARPPSNHRLLKLSPARHLSSVTTAHPRAPLSLEGALSAGL